MPAWSHRKLIVLAILSGAGLLQWSAKSTPADDAPSNAATAVEEEAAEPVELTPEAQQVADELLETLPEGSEARAMLDAILDGSHLSSSEGWFALAVAQSRYGWDYASANYDTDGDGSISLEEFGGTEQDFARLDRDGDDGVTEADFDWSDSSLKRTAGLMLYFMSDADANGKVTPEEFQQYFNRLDTDGHGFLSVDDLRDSLELPTPSNEPSPDDPSRSTLVLGLRNQEIGSMQEGPDLNEEAPDFTLRSLDGDEVTLSEEIGEQPVVLIFGNFTCGPFRSQAGNIEKLYERYRDRAKFFLIYVREAHPTDSWWMLSNQRVGIEIAQPRDDNERFVVAQTCREHLDIDIPFLVDNVDDAVGAGYSGMPNRLYLIDGEGRVAFKNGRGPFGFHPRQLEQALLLMLAEEDSQ
jgi:Ca2+-binding EF-hand superfamily protein